MPISVNHTRASSAVAIPVNNEADRIADCLHALSHQTSVNTREAIVVLLLNNCSDGTRQIVDRLAPGFGMRIRCLEVTFSRAHATAGHARHLAMRLADDLVEPDGVLLTTDADGRVDPNWIAQNLRALDQGADAVAGRIDIDPLEASLIPAKLHEDDDRECFYSALLDRISAELDPDPFDRLPRHSEHSGASIAVKVSAYRRAGGIPAVSLGEDRAFFAALRRVDARIRHAPEVRVVVSGRTIGRAAGGMADTIRRRMIRADEVIDDRLEPAKAAARRAQIRRVVRIGWSSPRILPHIVPFLARELLMLPSEIYRVLSATYFGAAWAELESRSATLIRRRVLVADLAEETKQAQAILAMCYRRNDTGIAAIDATPFAEVAGTSAAD